MRCWWALCAQYTPSAVDHVPFVLTCSPPQRDEYTRHELVEEAVVSRLGALEQQLQAQVAAQQQALQAEILDGPLVAGLDRGLQDAIGRARGLAREWGTALKWPSYRVSVTCPSHQSL